MLKQTKLTLMLGLGILIASTVTMQAKYVETVDPESPSECGTEAGNVSCHGDTPIGSTTVWWCCDAGDTCGRIIQTILDPNDPEGCCKTGSSEDCGAALPGGDA